jgi:cytidine deaminase
MVQGSGNKAQVLIFELCLFLRACSCALYLVPCALSIIFRAFMQKTFEFSYEVYNSIDELDEKDASLLREAREITKNAYAPYSKFHVGAAARLSNGKILSGTNQENASYPVSICAERTLLSTISSLYPHTAIDSMAISYDSKSGKSDHPISPCGMCRQYLQESEMRIGAIRLILGGMSGKVYIISSASQLLPLAFTGEELG